MEPVTLKPVATVSASIIQQARQKKEIQVDSLQRSVSTTSLRSNKSYRSTQLKSNLRPIRDEEEISIKKNARKSMSMDNIHINLGANLDANEPSVTSAALDWIDKDNGLNTKSKLNPIQPDASRPKQQYLLYEQAPIKSRGLFGSLRQVSRSKTFQPGNGVNSIKGLVRNFSSSHQHHKSKQTSSFATEDTDSTGMSRAAMAVIQHNVTKQEQKKTTSVIPDEKQDKRRSDKQEEQEKKEEKRQIRARSKSDANTGSRLISQLISRATSASRSKKNNTKVVNMEADAAAKKRAQVVRKTIIYVQPDSLHDLLKNGGEGNIKMPPLPPSNDLQQQKTHKSRTAVVSDGSLSPDDETIRSREYVTATKVSRQTSVRKRVVGMNNNDANQCSPLTDVTNNQNGQEDDKLSRNGSNSRRRWQLQSMEEDELMRTQSSKKTSSSSSGQDYMEGVELREMSDGSVVWGIVKKQGNRKSFYAPNKKNEYEHIEDEVEDVPDNDYFQQNVMKNNLSPSPSISRTASNVPPPPIPRRSPRRQISNGKGTSASYISTHSSKYDSATTDIYYSDEVTLPSLLKMMQGHDSTAEAPSDDELELEDNYTFNERAMCSVDDQLDEMMRILTSQQQEQQRIH